jgi:hypothetical protein
MKNNFNNRCVPFYPNMKAPDEWSNDLTIKCDKPINISVTNTGNAGNPFVNWTPSTGNFGNTSNSITNISTFNQSNINIPTGNTQSFSNNIEQNSTQIITRYQNLMKGFTGQVLGGANHDKRHCRDYSEKPQVNKEMLAAARKIDRDGTSKSVNFLLFHKHYLNDDDMYWLSSIFNNHTPKGLAVNTVDLSNNCLTLVKDSNLGYVDLPFFSFNSPYNTPRNILRLDLSNNNISDAGAKIVADGLANGVFPITKQVNLSGNKITETGETYLMNAVKVSANTDLNVFAVKAGWRNTDPMWKQIAKSTLKGFLKHAKNQGIDTEHVATNKSALDYILNIYEMGKNMLFGWGKCSNTLLEILSFNTNAPSITKGFALEMYGTKAMKKADFRICMAIEAHDAVVSIEGVELAVKTVDLLGDGE